MLARTHLLLGLAGYTAAVHYGQAPLQADLIAAVALGSLAPDIDHPKSRLNRSLPPLGWLLRRLLRHRGFCHSLVALATLAALCAMLHGPQPQLALPGIAFSLAYAGHVLADGFTRGGVPLFWPLTRRSCLPVMRTGGIGEWGLALSTAGGIGYLLAQHEGTLRQVFASLARGWA